MRSCNCQTVNWDVHGTRTYMFQDLIYTRGIDLVSLRYFFHFLDRAGGFFRLYSRFFCIVR